MASTIAGYIGKINPGDGTNYSLGSTAYGVCDTGAGTAAKTVEMTGFKLATGATIFIKFTNANTVASPTLNVQSTGAKPIVLYGTTAAGTTAETNGWQAGAVLCLTYDGTSWVRDQGYNTNTNTDTLVKQTAKTDDVNYKLLLTELASPTPGTAYEANYGANLIYNPSANKLSTGNIKLTGELDITGNAYLRNETSADSLTAGSLLVNGAANFVQSPNGPTAAAGDSSTKLATTEFVNTAIASGTAGAVAWNNITGKPNVVTYSSSQTATVAGTSKTTYTYNQTAIFAPNGLIMGGTAAAAGLVTRGICGVSQPDNTTGACTKSQLYLNYDSNNTNNPADRGVVINAGTVGNNLGNGIYQYTAVRGDAMKAWVEAKNYATTEFVTNSVAGLSGAMHFKGIASSAMTDGQTTNPTVTGISSYTPTAGDVVLAQNAASGDSNKKGEFVYTGSWWELLGDEGSYKIQQTAVTSPNASGNTTAFIDTISQNVNGDITVTKKNLDTSGTWSGTATKAIQDESGNNIVNTYATKAQLEALDATLTGTPGAGKTLTAFSQTDGKVTATFSDINIAKSQINDFDDNDFLSLNIDGFSSAIDITPSSSSVNLNNIITKGNYYFTSFHIGSLVNGKMIQNMPYTTNFNTNSPGFLKIFEDDSRVYQLLCYSPGLVAGITFNMDGELDNDLGVFIRAYNKNSQEWTNWKSFTKNTYANLNGLNFELDTSSENLNSTFNIYEEGEFESLFRYFSENYFGFESNEENVEDYNPMIAMEFLNKLYKFLIEHHYILTTFVLQGYIDENNEIVYPQYYLESDPINDMQVATKQYVDNYKPAAANLTTTQNAIAKYSDTTGTFANSGVTIDSSNNIATSGDITTKGTYIFGTNTSNKTNRYISSDATNNIFAKINNTYALVVTDAEVRRGASASTMNLGNSSYPWNNIYGTNIHGNGSALTSLNASNLSSGTVAFARLPSMYWANTAVASAASYNTTPEVASIKIGNGTATAAGAKGATLQYDATLEVLNFVFT